MRTVVAVAAVVGLAACSSGGSSSPTTGLPVTSSTTIVATTPPASTAAPITVGASTTAASTSAPPMPSTTAAVLDLLAPLGTATGLVVVFPAGDVTVVSRAGRDESGTNAAVVHADGSVTVLPATVGRVDQAVRQGASVLLVSRTNQVDRYVLADRRLERVPLDLPAGRHVSLVSAGDAVLAVDWDVQAFSSDNGPASVRVSVVHADGTVMVATPPPDPWAVALPGTITVWTGRELVTYAAESQAFDGGLRHPTAYDPATDAWRTLSDPPWAECAAACTWYAPHEGGAPQAFAWTGERTFVRTSLDGTELVALHDVANDRWERLPVPPIAVSDAWIEATPAQVVLFSKAALYDFPGAAPARTLGTAAVLDLAARSWSTAVFAAPPADPTTVSLCPVRLAAGLYVAACPIDPSGAAPASVPPVVLDRSTGAWAPATAAQQREALLAGPLVAVRDLAAAIAAR